MVNQNSSYFLMLQISKYSNFYLLLLFPHPISNPIMNNEMLPLQNKLKTYEFPQKYYISNRKTESQPILYIHWYSL